MATETSTAPAGIQPVVPATETAKGPEKGRGSIAARQDVFIYTFASGLVVFGMVLLVVSVILLVGLSVAGFPVDWGWLAVLFAFLLILTGLFLAWYYRSLLVKKAEPKVYAPPYMTPASSYPPVSSYQPYSYGYPQYPGYSYPQYAYGQPQGYGQYGAYNPYATTPSPGAVPTATAAAPAAAMSAPEPAGPSKACTSCGRAVPAEANFCPFCRTRL